MSAQPERWRRSLPFNIQPDGRREGDPFLRKGHAGLRGWGGNAGPQPVEQGHPASCYQRCESACGLKPPRRSKPFGLTICISASSARKQGRPHLYKRSCPEVDGDLKVTGGGGITGLLPDASLTPGVQASSGNPGPTPSQGLSKAWPGAELPPAPSASIQFDGLESDPGVVYAATRI